MDSMPTHRGQPKGGKDSVMGKVGNTFTTKPVNNSGELNEQKLGGTSKDKVFSGIDNTAEKGIT